MIAGLLRTLFWLVLAWTVFRFLDRMFGGGRKRGAQGGRPGRGRGPRGASGPMGGDSRFAPGRKAAKDDHLGEYVDYEEVEADE